MKKMPLLGLIMFFGLMVGIEEINPNGSPECAGSSTGRYVAQARSQKPRLVLASWYGPGFHGRPTASGAIFDMFRVSAAHKTLPLGTRLRVTNPGNGRVIRVIVTDRGPYIPGRDLDLSYEAAKRLGFAREGLALLVVEINPLI